MHAWNFRTCRHQKTLQLDCRAVKMRQHEHTRLAVLCCCDHSVRVVDAQQMIIVRFMRTASIAIVRSSCIRLFQDAQSGFVAGS